MRVDPKNYPKRSTFRSFIERARSRNRKKSCCHARMEIVILYADKVLHLDTPYEDTDDYDAEEYKKSLISKYF